MNKIVTISLFTWLILLSQLGLRAQNNTSSPYSSLGIGDIRPLGLGASQGMGGVGIAISPKNYFNYTNPAANYALPEKVSMLDLGFFYKRTQSSDGNTDQNTMDFNLNYFSFIFSPSKAYSLNFGLKPYSSIGYNVDILTNVEGSREQYRSRYTGTGGLNQLFWGNTYQIGQNFSVGANLSFIWGQVTTEETILLSSSSNNVVRSDYTYSMYGWKADLGLLYQIPLGENHKLQLGAILERPYGYQGTYTETITTSTQTGTGEEPELEDISSIKLPFPWGTGISLSLNNTWTVGLDYYVQNWSEAVLWSDTDNLRNSSRISLGIEYAPKPKVFGKKRLPILRAGLSYADTYLEIRDIPIREYSGSLGVGIPLKGAGSINLSYEYIRRGTTTEGLIRENSHVLSLSTTLADLWFVKRKVD